MVSRPDKIDANRTVVCLCGKTDSKYKSSYEKRRLFMYFEIFQMYFEIF